MQNRLQSDVLVPLYGMEDFEASLVRLNKKAQAFGLDPIKVVTSAQQRYYWQTRDTSAGGETHMILLKAGEEPPYGQAICVVNRLSLDYPIVKLGDWSVIGQIEAGSGGNLLFSVSSDPNDQAMMRAHADCPINCEHCNTKRARKLSYLLKNGAGGYKEVGSTCLEDFTGIDPGTALFMQKMHVFWREYGEEGIEAGVGRVSSIPVRGYLARVLFCMEEGNGFISAATARERGIIATYQHAAGLDHDFIRDSRLRNRFHDSYARHAAYAQKIIDWWKSADSGAFPVPNTVDSFAHNVKILLAKEDIELKNKYLALAAGAVAGYQKQLAKRAEENVDSVHIGDVGQKRDELLILRSTVSWETVYGVQWRVNFSDGQGNRLSWRTSSPPSDLLEPQAIGRSLSARFKVKKHDVYKGVATTEVSHLKVDRWLELDTPEASSAALITIRPDTVAFCDLGLREELANIVRAVGEQIDRFPGESSDVYDTNGNTVGSITYAGPEQDVAHDVVRVFIQVSPDGAASEVAAAVARAILAGDTWTGVEDDKGQVIGAIEFGGDVLVQEHSAPRREASLELGM